MTDHVDLPAQVRILLVDDDPDQRLSTAALLSRRGFEHVAEAGDGDTAVRMAPTFDPHLILLDLAMPGRSGVDVLPELRAAVPNALVVVLSNLPRAKLLEPVIQRGAVGYVEKSVSPERLVDEILVAAAMTDIARTHVLDLPATPASISQARHFARDLLDDADRRLVGDVQLLVSEVMSNAVIHAHGDPRLAIHVHRDTLRVEVFDEDPDLPLIRDPDVERPGGRGLRLLDDLADRWGSDRTSRGKVVWFEVERPAPNHT